MLRVQSFGTKRKQREQAQLSQGSRDMVFGLKHSQENMSVESIVHYFLLSTPYVNYTKSNPSVCRTDIKGLLILPALTKAPPRTSPRMPASSSPGPLKEQTKPEPISVQHRGLLASCFNVRLGGSTVGARPARCHLASLLASPATCPREPYRPEPSAAQRSVHSLLGLRWWDSRLRMKKV